MLDSKNKIFEVFLYMQLFHVSEFYIRSSCNIFIYNIWSYSLIDHGAFVPKNRRWKTSEQKEIWTSNLEFYELRLARYSDMFLTGSVVSQYVAICTMERKNLTLETMRIKFGSFKINKKDNSTKTKISRRLYCRLLSEWKIEWEYWVKKNETIVVLDQWKPHEKIYSTLVSRIRVFFVY